MTKENIETLKGGRRMPHKLEAAYIYMIDELKQQLVEKDKEIENCKARIEELAEQRENLCQETEMLKSWKETYYKYWKETQKQLQQQLAEKDKEIEKLKAISNAIKTATEAGIKIKDLISIDTSDIRHEVCEEIRKYILRYYNYNGNLCIEINPVGFYEFLDQIEKGESE